MGLGEGDAVLLIAVAEDSYYVAPGNDFATILTNQAVDDLESRFSSASGYVEFLYWHGFHLSGQFWLGE